MYLLLVGNNTVLISMWRGGVMRLASAVALYVTVA